MIDSKTRTTLIIAFGLMLIFILLLTSAGGYLLISGLQRVEDVVAQNVRKSELISDLRIAGRLRSLTLSQMLLMDDPIDRADEYDRFNAFGTEFIVARNALADSILSQQEKDIFEATSPLSIKIGLAQRKIIASIDEQDFLKGRDLQVAKSIPLQRQTDELFKQLQNLQRVETVNGVKEATEEFRGSLYILLSMALFILLAISVIGRFVVRYTGESERRLSKQKEQAETVLHSITDGVISCDVNRKVISINDAAENLTGLMHSSVKGFSLSSVLALEGIDWVTWDGNITPAICVNRNKARIPVEVSIHDVCDENGDIDSRVTVIKDITERTRAERALKIRQSELEKLVRRRTVELTAAKDLAEQANKTKTEFLSRMSHELRTPLNAILGFSQLLQLDYEKSLTLHQAKNLFEIETAGNHLLELINELLDLSRIESGKVEINNESIPLFEIVNECVKMVLPLAQERGLTIVNSLAENRVIISADKLRLKQVLLNILSNAIKYNYEKGSVYIDVPSIDSNFARLTIKDTGIGISDENRKRVFNDFERLSSHAGIEGSGIGLSVTRHLVEVMGGKIGVDNSVDDGCTFWIEFPIK
ncbi:MAG: PAS domain S-box protein [Sulfuriflexus sp.]|nr:PAS domain S-box protein [Sulfuriflexus sp.]